MPSGTFAIICMMAGKSVTEFSAEYSAIQVATALSIVVGIWQVGFHELPISGWIVVLMFGFRYFWECFDWVRCV